MSIENTRFSPKEIEKQLLHKKSIYFIGVGGVSMSCIARMAKNLGYTVAGSDRTPSEVTRQLQAEGIPVYHTHAAEHIISCDVIVYTVAIQKDNPEYTAAKEKGIPCISRADFLGYLMHAYRQRIGVSGMHGKSTTSSMISEIFLHGTQDPTIVLGAELPSIQGCYRSGGSEWFIFEACEYMDSFLSFAPTVEVILNIELDHTDYFPDLTAVKHSFASYLALPSTHTAVLNWDDANVKEIAASFAGKKITFALHAADADYTVDDLVYCEGKASFNVYYQGKILGRICLSVFGEHNVQNALAAAATAHTLGIPFSQIAEGLYAFRGARRRMEYHGELQGASIYEDYAHHPTEIRSTLSAAKKITQGRVFVVFQSHTYSRTAELWEDFLSALSLADRAVILDIYSARETDTRGVSGEKMAASLGKRAVYASSFTEAANTVEHEIRENDLVIVMGAGDVFHVLDSWRHLWN